MWVRNKLKLSSTSGATASSSSSSQLMMKSNWTALHQAAKKGDVDRAKRLLADGSADPNASTTEPFDNLPEATTALHVAAQFGHLSIVQLLFDSGKRVNVNAVDDHGWTAAHRASMRGFADVVEILAFHGCDVNMQVRDSGYTSLAFAAFFDHVNVFEALCAFDADVEAKERHGRTALRLAVARNNLRSARLLLSLGADTSQLINRSETAAARRLTETNCKTNAKEREEMCAATRHRIRAQLAVRLMRYAQPQIIGMCLAMSSLELPPYVLLWIIDWLPNYDRLSHHKKIQLIESVRNSIWRIKDNRD